MGTERAVHTLKLKRLSIAVSVGFDWTLIGVACGIVLFYLCSWHRLTETVAISVTDCLNLAGYPAANRLHVIHVNGYVVAIGPECTYIDWFLIAVPLCLGLSTRCLKRIILFMLLLILWYSLNVFRICLGIGLLCGGHSWFVCHDLPDYILWYMTMTFIVAVWFRKNVSMRVI